MSSEEQISTSIFYYWILINGELLFEIHTEGCKYLEIVELVPVQRITIADGNHMSGILPLKNSKCFKNRTVILYAWSDAKAEIAVGWILSKVDEKDCMWAPVLIVLGSSLKLNVATNYVSNQIEILQLSDRIRYVT